MNSTALPAQIGKYWVKTLLGTGGMGRVFLAVDPDIGREVAIKLVTLGSDPQASERFLREAQTMGRLNHPNIVTLLEFGVDQQSPFLVLEFLAGEDLSQWMLRPHTLREQVQAMLDIAQAIAAAHKAGVLHRDLKPENVRVLDDGRCKLLDFGIAQSGAGQLTASGYFVGTPEFVAPEVMTGSAHSVAADVYALGLLFYTMLCGSNPFRGDNVQTTVARVVQLEPPPLSKRLAGIPVDLAALIHSCLAKDAEQRPASADRLVQGLTRELAKINPDARLGELPPPSNTALMPTTPAPSKTQAAVSVTPALVAQPATRGWWALVAALLLVSLVSAWWLLQPRPAITPKGAPPSAVVAPAEPGPQPVAAAAPPTVAPASVEPEPKPKPKPAQPPPGADLPAAIQPDSPGMQSDPAPPTVVVENRASEPPEVRQPDPLQKPRPATTEVTARPAGVHEPSVEEPPASMVPAPEPAPPVSAAVPSVALPIEPSSSPAPAEPLQVEISRFSPRTLRAGRAVTLRLEGSGLASVNAVVVGSAGAPDPRFRVGALTHVGDGGLEFNLNVARGVPLGTYALILQGENLRAAPVLLEVSL